MLIQEGSLIFKSESIKNLYTLIRRVQKLNVTFTANAENKAFAKGGQKGNLYSPLPQMMEDFNSWCIIHDIPLVFSSSPSGKGIMTVMTDIESGEFEYRFSSYPFASGVGINDYKGMITASTRYALAGWLNIPADPDNDQVEISHPDTFGYKPDNSVAEKWLNPTDADFPKIKDALKSKKTTLAEVNKKYKLSGAIISSLLN